MTNPSSTAGPDADVRTDGRWLVTGAHGMLGRDLIAVLADRDLDVTATDRDEVDITDLDATRAAVAGHDIVVNTAAFTDVDGAETAETTATLINGVGPENLATACAERGIPLIHISTDYVFAGDGVRSDAPPAGDGGSPSASPYEEYAPTDPINAYGRSKLVGEQAVLRLLPRSGYVVRTAWLYGANGHNFVATMLRLAERADPVDVVDDQRGQPTWSYALAERLADLGAAALAGTAPAGIYHGTATGETTWYEFARAVFAGAGHDPQRVRPTTSDRYRRAAKRPSYSVLGHDRWASVGMPPLADWQVQLAAALPVMLKTRTADDR